MKKTGKARPLLPVIILIIIINASLLLTLLGSNPAYAKILPSNHPDIEVSARMVPEEIELEEDGSVDTEWD